MRGYYCSFDRICGYHASYELRCLYIISCKSIYQFYNINFNVLNQQDNFNYLDIISTIDIGFIIALLNFFFASYEKSVDIILHMGNLCRY